MGSFFDEDPTVDNMDRSDVYLSNLPSGASYHNFVHYAQLINEKTETFKRYDYDNDRINLEHYGQKTPPAYNLSLLDFPIAIFGGKLDKLVDPKDVDWTYQQLQKTVIFYQQYELGHMSFAIARDMTWFTQDVMDILNHYNFAKNTQKNNMFLY